MPYLTLETPPPSSKDIEADYRRSMTSKGVEEWAGVMPTESKLVEDLHDEILTSAYPVVKLDCQTITDATAGRLATSLLGHVLFLKNQVPFPVMQLGRIPGGKTNTRTFKQRTELLTSYDTISSHLDTTFSALSNALVRCSHHTQRKVAQAYLAILVGPSIGTAKSKVILGIDGLEMRVWGRREDVTASHQSQDNESDEEDEEDEPGEDGGEDSGDSAEEPQDSDEDDEGSDEEEDVEEDEEDESEDGDETTDEVPSSSPPPYISHAEEQRFLQNADRLLSRILATADADGNGITSEMSPTQTHILIRAPRRFSHPAWIPRQNVTASLDLALGEFLHGTGLDDSEFNLPAPPKQNKRYKVEGVWITPRTGIQRRALRKEETITPLGQKKGQEEDDMIWWSWDGKFVGFADW